MSHLDREPVRREHPRSDGRARRHNWLLESTVVALLFIPGMGLSLLLFLPSDRGGVPELLAVAALIWVLAIITIKVAGMSLVDEVVWALLALPVATAGVLLRLDRPWRSSDTDPCF
jgi:hypothetical protein